MRNGLLTRSQQYVSLRKHTWITRPIDHPQHGFLYRGCLLHQYQTIRGAKSRATIQLSDLGGRHEPTGPGLAKEADGDGKVYPTVVLQALKNMRKYEKCVLLTKVGSFYEVIHHLLQLWIPLIGLIALF